MDANSYQKASKQIDIEPLNITAKQIDKLDSIEGRVYSLNFHYPEFSGYKNINALNKFNKLIVSIKDSVINAFIEKIKNDYNINPGNGKSELSYVYSIAYNRNAIVSIKFDTYPGYAGYSENEAVYSALNYNLKTGKEIRLKDLFRKDSDYLKILYNYCLEDLHTQAIAHNKVPQDKRPITFLGGIDDDWILDYSKENWIQPLEQNYNFFVLTEKGIEFNFVPSLIQGFYPGKPDKVLVPYSNLQNVIEPRGPIGFVSKK